MKIRWLLRMAKFALAVNVVGCASTQYRITSGHERPAFEGTVLVYQKAPPRGVQYTVIGDFVEQKQWYGATVATKREALRAAAAKGANGILIERSGQRVTGWSWSSPYTEGKLLWIANYGSAASAQRDRPAGPSAEDRLEQLDSLHRQGLISDSEFQAKRKEIVKSL
jgi:hypothetical protein